MTRIEHPLDPVFDKNSRVLVLGSMPSPASRRANFYYGHPQNRFWQTTAAVFADSVPVSINEKTLFLLRHRIALWDVLQSCDITGADDASIQNPVAHDFTGILRQAPITSVFTTGKKAYALYTALCAPHTGIPAIYLPSTSPANRGRWPLERLIEAYRILADAVSS